jgi:hypothetical protein
VVYTVVEILPNSRLSVFLRRSEAKALQTIDPMRDYREAKSAFDGAPTMGNRMRMARAAGEQGHWEAAESLFRTCLEGQFAEDPAALLGHARALVELNRFEEAITRIDQLRALGREGPQEALVFARAAQGLGENADAEEAYAFAAPRIPSLEAHARYIVFLRATDQEAQARKQLADFDFRLARIPSHFQAEAKAWRAFAVN